MFKPLQESTAHDDMTCWPAQEQAPATIATAARSDLHRRRGIAHARNTCLPPVIKHLTRGCVTTERDSTGTAYRWKITGLAFKGETTTRGVRATWVAGHPAARAVAVLERLQPPGQSLLFARLPFREGTRPGSSAAVLTTAATQNALADFTAWVNGYCAASGRAGAVPIPGVGEPLTTRRFRRTLAGTSPVGPAG
jgi:hypothetical protein